MGNKETGKNVIDAQSKKEELLQKIEAEKAETARAEWLIMLNGEKGIKNKEEEERGRERLASSQRRRAEYEAELEKIEEARKIGTGERPTAEEWGERAFEALTRENAASIKTGVPFIDRIFGGGLDNQKFYILIAETGIGKTTLCQYIAESIAKQRRGVLYFNFEMSERQLIAKGASRFIAQQYGEKINAQEILRIKEQPQSNIDLIHKALKEYGEAGRFITYGTTGAGNSIDAIEETINAAAATAKAKGEEAPVVFIDYLHLMAGKNRQTEQETLKEAVEMLKKYAMKNNSIAFGIAAANREASKAGLITLESSRDSSSIEYQADAVISINYTEFEKIDSTTGKPAKQTMTPERMEEIKTANPRILNLRMLKGRFGTAPKETISLNLETGVFEEVEQPAPKQPEPQPKPKQRLI